MVLRLLPPPGEGQPAPAVRRRKGHKPAALFLTPDEARRTRCALKNAARAYGGADVLAAAMCVSVQTLYHASAARRPLSGTFAIRLARAAGVSVEAMLGGAIGEASVCRTCGHRVGAGRFVAGGGS